MKLSIYSLKNILFQGDASLLNCQTAVGEITVLDNHEPLISVLTTGTIKIFESDWKKPELGADVLPKSAIDPHIKPGSREKEHFFLIKSGFLEVKHGNEVRCIVEQ